jgi:hypothetical protein
MQNRKEKTYLYAFSFQVCPDFFTTLYIQIYVAYTTSSYSRGFQQVCRDTLVCREIKKIFKLRVMIIINNWTND